MKLIKSRAPEVSPTIFMTDRDQAQVNAIREVYPNSRALFCWWHVLRAIRCHFVVTEFPDLWTLIQKWVHSPDLYKFDTWWDDIQNDKSVPKSLVEYLAREWLPVKEMWSAVYRQDRSIFEEGDTNMLLEAYVIINMCLLLFLILAQISSCIKIEMVRQKVQPVCRFLTSHATNWFIAQHQGSP